jgi:O-antigen/teichoic acid export membrane protein
MKVRGIKTNFIFNIIGPLLSLVVMLIATPIYIWHIGNARFGLLSITWGMLGYFGFLDLGLSQASANALAKLGDPSSGEERAKVLTTVLWVNLCMGIVGGFIFYFSGSFIIEHLLTVPADLKPEIDTAFPWIASVLPLALVGGIGYGALESRERFLAANVLQVVGSTVGVVAPVICAVYISPSLTLVIPAAVIARLLSVMLALGFALRGESHLSPWSFDWKRARALLSYGGWVSIATITGQILASVDQLVIGAVLGVAAVAYYAVPVSLVLRSQLLAAALSRTLFPRMSRFTPAEAKGLAQKALVTLAYAYGAICGSAIVLARPLLELWMGKDFGSIAGPIAELLFIGGWANGLFSIFFVFLQGQGRPDVVAKVNSFGLIPYIILLWFLVSRFGLLGAGGAWDLMVTSVTGIVFAAARFHPARLVQLVPPLGFVLAAYLYVCIWPPGILGAFLVAGVVAASACAGAMVFDPYTRQFVTSMRFPKHFQRASKRAS